MLTYCCRCKKYKLLLLELGHEGLQRVVQGLHEVPHVDGGGGPGELGGEALVSVGQDVLILMMLPSVENISDIEVVGEVLAAVLDNVHHEVCLEVDLLVAVLELLVPQHPGSPALIHGLVVGKPDLANQMLGQPQPDNIEHGEGVVLVLKNNINECVLMKKNIVLTIT